MKAGVIRYLLVFSAALFLLQGCVPDGDGTLFLREDYLGTWDVHETEGNFAPQYYSVDIIAGPGEDDIIISRLYNASGTRVEVIVNGPNLSIPTQQTAGISFSGSGSANSDLTRIDLSFTANDGTGNDQVRAELTR